MNKFNIWQMLFFTFYYKYFEWNVKNCLLKLI